MSPHYSTTNLGLYIQLPLAEIEDYRGYYYAFLACTTANNSQFEPDRNSGWPVMYLQHKLGGSKKEFVRTRFHGELLGFRTIRTVRNLSMETQRIWLSVEQKIWPLVWRSYIPGTNRSSVQTLRDVADRTERNLVVDLETNLQALEIADAWPPDVFLSSSRISLPAHAGKWCCQYYPGRHVFPPISPGFLAGRHILHGLSLHPNYGFGHHVVALAFQSGMIGGRMLMVFVIMDGLWFLLLTNMGDNESARHCYSQLLGDGDNGSKVWSTIGIPFSLEQQCSISRGRFNLLIEPQVRLTQRTGHVGLKFRVAVTLAPPQGDRISAPTLSVPAKVSRYFRFTDPYADRPDAQWEESDCEMD
jgi:hypothetical protein